MVNFSVFNELSLPLNEYNAECNFGSFLRLLKGLKNKNLNQIRMSTDFRNYNILENTTFEKFVGKQKEAFQTRLKSFIANSIVQIDTPIIKSSDKEQLDTKNITEYFFDNKPIDGGLACCDIWNTVAISFNTDEKWNKSKINIQKQTMDENDLIIDSDISIKHASSVNHLESHKTFFVDLEEENQFYITQNNFWENRKINFPKKIEFCKEVEDNIKKLDSRVFENAKSILRDIEREYKKLIDFSFTGESKSVHNDPKLKNLRMFTVGDKKIFFDNHIKSLPNNNRIHFFEQDSRIYIGYIGKHLRTKKYK